MLEIKNISSGYGKKKVLFDVSLQVKTGEIVLLNGSNGSGKSTLLKCIYNILPLWAGEIFFENKKISELKSSDLIKRRIVYIPQKDFCFENLTVEENFQISGTIYNKADLKQRISNVYKETGLEQFKNRKPFNLSGGEKKLLAFGMGLVHQPKLILLDEPFAGVDTVNSQKLFNIFLSFFKKGDVSVILVEHKDAGNNLFTRKIIMELGNIKSN
ncbi:MAG: ATP-binding cassette domain-containing protein [Bacteroidetes bacterium]|nr:ATP-binding cassette domain-containing protein [Bacteroidota bacterium]